jgi:hypothetical protein
MSCFKRFYLGIGLFVAVSLAVVLLWPSPVVPATACEVGYDAPLFIEDTSLVSQSLVNEAEEIAAEMFGHDQQEIDQFTGQLLATYLVAREVDVLVIVNSGGWGWSSIEASPHGPEFVAGLDAELATMGYSTLWLDFYRTPKTLNGCLSELMMAPGLYLAKAEDLAARVDFLTRHIPGLRILLTGESNGCTICHGAMHILDGNPQVFSIQLGPPFWNNSDTSERSLILRTNGIIPDAFSQGDIFTIVRANLEALLGISQQYPGNILLYIGAPGHDYSWQNPGVGAEIKRFLMQYFA